MSQALVINALQNGPLTSNEVANLTGMSKETVLSTAKKLRYKGELTTRQVKAGRYWMAEYTLTSQTIEQKQSEPIDKLSPFDIRNAKGIFTPSEYRIMNAQARNFYKSNPTFTTYSKAVSSENNR
jgi:biotin operon repressor